MRVVKKRLRLTALMIGMFASASAFVYLPAQRCSLERDAIFGQPCIASPVDVTLSEHTGSRSVDAVSDYGEPNSGASPARDEEYGDLSPGTERNKRLEMIAELANVADSGSIADLQAMLDDPLAAVREEAVEALAATERPDIVVSLAYALSDENVMVRRLAIESLAANGSDDALGALALGLYDDNKKLRRLIVEELADNRSEAALLVLQNFLADEDRSIRELTQRILGY